MNRQLQTARHKLVVKMPRPRARCKLPDQERQQLRWIRMRKIPARRQFQAHPMVTILIPHNGLKP